MLRQLLLCVVLIPFMGNAQDFEMPDIPETALMAPTAYPGFVSFYGFDGTPLDTNVVFNEEGQLVASGQMDNGVPMGSWQAWHPNGKVSATGTIEGADMTGLWTFYHDNGKVAAKGYMDTMSFELGCAGSGNYKQMSYYVGAWTYYHENGSKSDVIHFKDGGLHGEYIGYFADGTVKLKGTLKEGHFNGKWEEFYPSGKIKTRSWHAWLPEVCGNKVSTSAYDSPWFGYDCKIGAWEWFNEAGELTKKEVYDDHGYLFNDD